MAFFCSNIEKPERVGSRINEHFSVMEEETKDERRGDEKKKKKPLIIHPRRSNMFEVPLKVARVKKAHGSKQQQVVMESFVKSLDTEEQWEQFLALRSRMAVIEVSQSENCQALVPNPSPPPPQFPQTQSQPSPTQLKTQINPKRTGADTKIL